MLSTTIKIVPVIFFKKGEHVILVICANVSALLQFSLYVCTAGNWLSNGILFPFIGCVRIDQLEVKVFALF
jgi:hypothetical protein